jgi:phospholipid/cholesterol/gamma-HCH transport system permease protein
VSAVRDRFRPPQPPTTRGFGEIWSATTAFTILQTWSGIGTLGVKAVECLFRPPFSWLADAVTMTNRFLHRCLLPLAISVFFWVIGYAFVDFLGFVKLVGVQDRMPGGLVLAFTREVMFWVTGMIFAGAVGASVTADIAARKNREELDAFSVMGVDQVRLLVLPRVVGAALACSAAGLFSIFGTIVTTYAFAPAYTPLSHAIVWDGIVQSMLAPDYLTALLKYFLFGAFVGLVSCAKGLSASGGTAGVGRAVNECVVLLFAGLWVFNSLFNLVYLTVFPQLGDFKG